VDQREAARLAQRIQGIDPARHMFPAWRRGPTLHTDRVLNAAQVFDVRALGLIGAKAHPGEMRRQIEETGTAGHGRVCADS